MIWSFLVFKIADWMTSFIVVVFVCIHFSGRNIPSNQNTIHIYWCCVLYLYSGRNFPNEIFLQYKYNTNTNNFPAGIFRPIQIQYIHICCCCVSVVLTFIFRPEFSDRNIPSNTNTIHIYCCCVCLVFIFRPEFSGRNIPSNTNTIHV